MEELLLILNEWWTEGEISEEKAKEYKRTIFQHVTDTFMNYRQIVILTGLRRVGKTTLMFQIIKKLIDNGVNPKNILYFSFDERIENPLLIFKSYEKITKVNWKKEKIYVFFDEIHKLEDWSTKIKILYDNMLNIKLCVSGSASLMLEEEATKNLAGRYFLIEVEPLSLKEYAELYFNNRIDNYYLWKPRLEAIFEDFILKPFPEIVKWTDRQKINEYIRTLIIEKIVKSDIPHIFQKVNIKLISTLINIFLKDIGSTLNITSLAKELGVHKLTLLNHLYYLEFGKMFRIIKNYRPSIRAESRKLMKIYPYHPSLSLALYPETEKGKIIENLILSYGKYNKYWRKGEKEIDFLKINSTIIPIEIKYKPKIKNEDLKTMNFFLKKYNLKKGIVFYQGDNKTIKLNDKNIKLRSITHFCFNPFSY